MRVKNWDLYPTLIIHQYIFKRPASMYAKRAAIPNKTRWKSVDADLLEFFHERLNVHQTMWHVSSALYGEDPS